MRLALGRQAITPDVTERITPAMAGDELSARARVMAGGRTYITRPAPNCRSGAVARRSEGVVTTT